MATSIALLKYFISLFNHDDVKLLHWYKYLIPPTYLLTFPYLSEFKSILDQLYYYSILHVLSR